MPTKGVLHRIRDVRVAGPADGAACQVTTGHGQALISVPTAEGPVELVNNFTFEALGGSGKFDGDTYSGLFSFAALEGTASPSR